MNRMMDGIDYYLLKPLKNGRQRVIVATMATTNMLATLLNPLGVGKKKTSIQNSDSDCPPSALATQELELPSFYTPCEVRAVSIGDRSVRLQWEVAALPAAIDARPAATRAEAGKIPAHGGGVEGGGGAGPEPLLAEQDCRTVDEFEIGFRTVGFGVVCVEGCEGHSGTLGCIIIINTT